MKVILEASSSWSPVESPLTAIDGAVSLMVVLTPASVRLETISTFSMDETAEGDMIAFVMTNLEVGSWDKYRGLALETGRENRCSYERWTRWFDSASKVERYLPSRVRGCYTGDKRELKEESLFLSATPWKDPCKMLAPSRAYLYIFALQEAGTKDQSLQHQSIIRYRYRDQMCSSFEMRDRRDPCSATPKRAHLAEGSRGYPIELQQQREKSILEIGSLVREDKVAFSNIGR